MVVICGKLFKNWMINNKVTVCLQGTIDKGQLQELSISMLGKKVSLKYFLYFYFGLVEMDYLKHTTFLLGVVLVF